MGKTSKYWYLPSKKVVKTRKIKTGNGLAESVQTKELRTYVFAYINKKGKRIKKKVKLPKGKWVMLPSFARPFAKRHEFIFVKVPSKKRG